MGPPQASLDPYLSTCLMRAAVSGTPVVARPGRDVSKPVGTAEKGTEEWWVSIYIYTHIHINMYICM